jgi:diguanylate cyclase (GGDEF)-like protein/PAS domain S-box-containing protein
VKGFQEHFEKAFKHAAIGMALMTPDGRWFKVNRALCGFLGYPEHELLGITLRDVTYPEDLEKDLNLLRRMKNGEVRAYQMEKRYLRKDGSVVWGSLNRSLVRDDRDDPLFSVCQIQDISESKELEGRLAYQAYYDPLTGLPNRAALTEQLERSLASTGRRESSVALLFVDLDGFKKVNDSLGHEAGDELLAAVARRLKTCVRAGDTVARLGGDEFCLLLEDVAGPEDATRVLERVKECLESPFDVGDHYIPPITVSVGVAVQAPRDGRPAGWLLREADTAMYRTKHNGQARNDRARDGTAGT